MITPTQHEKNEWSRMAQAAYRAGRNSIGHAFSVAASMSSGQQMSPRYFYKLQNSYRAWLVFNEWEHINE